MKWTRIFALEFRYQLRGAAFPIAFAVLLAIAYLIVTANYSYDARDGYFLLNAPIVIAAVTAICSVKWLLVGASIAGDAAVRDIQRGMYPLTYTAPVHKATYLGGRFAAAFALNVLLLLAVPAGILLAMHGSGMEAGILGPFRAAAYTTSFAYLLLPNAFIATAIQFSLAVLSRKAMSSYGAGAVLLAAAYGIWMASPGAGEWRLLADPMNFAPVQDHLSTDWSPLEKDTGLLRLEGPLLANRLLWIGISLVLLAVTYARFELVIPEGRRNGKTRQQPAPAITALVTGTREGEPSLPQGKGSFGWATRLHQWRRITWKSFLQLAGSRPGLPLLALLALMTALALPGNLKRRGVPLLPRTDFLLEVLTAPLSQPEPFWIVITLLTIFYAGELVWRDRETGLSDLVHTAPVPDGVLFWSRFGALALLLTVWHVFLMLAGMGAQAALGGARAEIGLYVGVLFGLQLTDCLLFALLALVVQVLVNGKYTGHLVALLAYGYIVFAPTLGLEHKLLIYSASPAWTYTDMAGFGDTLVPWLWAKSYWAAWALALAVVATLLQVGGRDGSIAARLRIAHRRFTRPLALLTAVATAGILVTGGFIFYNTNVRHHYTSAAAAKAQQAAYEQRYGRYRHLSQPLLTGVHLAAEIYPAQRKVLLQGTYLLVNQDTVPIDSVHLATGAGVTTTGIGFDRPAREVLADADLGYHIYALTQPLRPGDSLRLRFRVMCQGKGFSNEGADAQVTAAGTAFGNREWLPVIGYQPYRELDAAGDRKAQGLPPRPATASLYDTVARRYAPFPEQIRFEAIVGTDTGQQVVAPGTLRRTWTRSGRRYFQYATEAPIRNEYTIFSAAYAVAEETWRPPLSGPQGAVAIQVYYPQGATKNPARMIRSAKASLDYYTRQFGPYPHRQLRFVAHAGYAFGHHAAPIDITAEEGFFLLNPEADERGFDLVTAVVAHETAHQWWGNGLKQAYVSGAGLITESLAWYSAMGVVEDYYGPEHLQRLLGYLREEGETPRTHAALPLLQGDDWYQIYRKGPLALYTLSQYIGRDRVNTALRQLLAHHRPGTLPRPTSLDLYRELQAETPDTLRPLLHDLFAANTFWELRAEKATAQRTTGGTWEVTLTLEAKKRVVDSAGRETELPVKDWVEIGIYAPAGRGREWGRQLYLQKHLLRSGRQQVVLEVGSRPGSAGIDPRQLLINWKVEEHFRKVQSPD